MRLSKMIGAGIFVLGLAISNIASAGCERQSTPTKYLNMDLGRVVVSPDIPVGGVITTRTWSFSETGINYRCTAGKYDFIAEILGNRTEIGDKIYSTNIPGIGLRMSRAGAVSMTYPSVYSVNISRQTSFNLAGSTFTLEIIKTAQTTGTGTLESGNYSSYDVEGGTDPILVTRLSGSSITIISPSCNVTSGTNMDINMGEVSKKDFQGLGSTAGNKNFNIDLQCNGGATITGYANINMSFSGQIPGTLSASSGVLQNESGSSAKAKGVGIQVIKDSRPIEFDKKYLLATLQSDETRFISVPLVAKYYQYENTITPGEVESRMVFNLNYD